MTLDKLQAPSPTVGGSHYVNRAAAERAVALAAPMIEQAMGDRSVVGSGFVHVVIMDPGLPSGAAAFDEAILHQHSFGDRERWDADYAAFALAKARLAWATGKDSQTMQDELPHLLRTGDTLLGGGICLDGIVVAASGAFPWFDELFAGAIALALRAIAREARHAERSKLALEPERAGMPIADKGPAEA